MCMMNDNPAGHSVNLSNAGGATKSVIFMSETLAVEGLVAVLGDDSTTFL